MQHQPSVQQVADQLEQLLLKIMLSVLSRLKDEIKDLKDGENMKF